MRIGAILHGRYRRAGKLEKDFLKEFGKRGIKVKIRRTTPNFTANKAATDLLEKECTHLLVAGGDGSLHQVVQTVMNIPDPDKRPVLILFPIGTGNDFARTTQATNKLDELVNKVIYRKPELVDVGCIDRLENGAVKTSHFINIADAGLGGDVARYLHNAPRWLGPELMYQWSIVRTFFMYRKQEISVKAGDFSYRGKALNVVAANGKFFGGGLHIAPGASIQDGLLNLVLLGNIGLFDYLKNIGNIRKGRKIQHPQVFYLQTPEIKIEAKNVSIEADGEFVGTDPIRFYVEKGAIQMCF